MGANHAYGKLGQDKRTRYASTSQIGSGTDGSAGESKLIGGQSTGAITTDGKLYMWGRNEYGILGLNSGSSNALKSSPTQVGTDTTWSKICSSGE